MPSCYPCPTPGIYINQQGSGGSNASQYRAHCSHSPLHNLLQWSCNVRSVEPLKRQTSLSTKNYRPVLKGSNSGLRWFQQYERRNIIHWVLAFYWFSNFFLNLVIDSEVMWVYEGSVASLSPQNIKGCFLELLFKSVISHRDLWRVLHYIVASPIRNVSPGTWILVLQSKLVV